MPIDLQIGFTSPMFRPYRLREPQRKRNPIGFVYFGDAVAMEGLEEFDDELHVGFTAPIDNDII